MKAYHLVDSHCHLNRLNLEPYGGSLSKAVDAACENGVSEILSVCTQLTEFPEILSLTQQFGDNMRIYSSVGVHPSESVSEEPSVDELIKGAHQPRVIAIGETGLDYHYEFVPILLQQERFRRHIQAARKVHKPIILHSREASSDMLALLKAEQAQEVGGVAHCFTGTPAEAKALLDLGFYIGCSGMVTFQKATSVREMIRAIPLDRLLLETDAPYLAPHPMRGKSNEPAFLKFTAEQLAFLKQTSFEEIARQTTDNFHRLFLKVSRE